MTFFSEIVINDSLSSIDGYSFIVNQENENKFIIAGKENFHFVEFS